MASKPKKSIVPDADPFNDYGCRHFHVTNRPAISVNYGIRNYSNKTICATSALLGYLEIESSENPEYHPNTVYLDIHITLDRATYTSGRFNINANTPLDIAIRDIAIQMFDRLDSTIDSYTISFSLPLYKVHPSKGNFGYYSEILGLYIGDLKNGIDHYINHIPEALLSGIDSGDTTYSEYEISYLIDNDNTASNVWTMVNGSPVKLKKAKHRGLASGLYIFSKELTKNGRKHRFIPVSQLDDRDILSPEGYATSQAELLELNHTKVFKALQDENKELKETKVEYVSFREEYAKLKRDHSAVSENIDKKVKEKLKIVEDENAERIRYIDEMHKRETEALKSELSKIKKDLNAHQSDDSKRKRDIANNLAVGTTAVGLALSVLRFFYDMTKQRKPARR